jgi:protein-L-isoaspartate(D-aspartate) O-methyltransferase
MRSADPDDPGAPRLRIRPDLAAVRELMVETQLRARGVRDGAVLEAMRVVPREAFLSERQAPYAYEDGPLPIGEGQTISQPYIVAVMSAAVAPRPADRVLEIGTGSGYSAAVLATIVREVYTIERLPALAESASRRLAALGYRNVHVRCGDGTLGWPEHAPYDAIIVTAGGPRIPPALLDQLGAGGRLVMPVGDELRHQELVRVRRQPDGTLTQEALEPVAFVPLIGAQGWPGPRGRGPSVLPSVVEDVPDAGPGPGSV